MITEENPVDQVGYGDAEPGPSGLGTRNSSATNDGDDGGDDDDSDDDDMAHEQPTNRNPTVTNDDDSDESYDDMDHEQPANRCRNCRLPTNGGLVCKRCLTLPRCRACKKYLSAEHFPDPDDSRCETCLKKVGKPRVRRAVDNSVREVEIPIDSLDLREFVSDHADTIDRLVHITARSNSLFLFEQNSVELPKTATSFPRLGFELRL